jgi:chemotaxis protein histidine kinase CheA
MLPRSLDFIRIDINSGKVRKSVAVCQNDTIQRTLNFLIVDSGTPIDLSNLLFAEILIHKADDYEADNGCVIDGDSIQYTLRSTDISALGTNTAQLMLTFRTGEVLTTPTFEIQVYQKVLDQRVQQSSNEYTALTAQLAIVYEKTDEVEANRVLVSEYTSEAANSKDEAASSAISASESADSALEYKNQAESMADQAASETASELNDYFSSQVSEAANYAGSASEYASVASSEASDAADYLSSTSEYMTSTSEYMFSASEYAQTAGSQASNAEAQASTAAGYMASTSAYTSEAANYLSSTSDLKSETADLYTATSEKASEASYSASEAADSADDAKYWYNQAEAIAEGLAGTLIPMGTVAFANLPNLSDALEGWMFNISDEFTTTSDFLEGEGKVIPAGSNVYKTALGKWDILAGSPVTGVKGDSESTYRRGNVNITKTNIGLSNVRNEDIGDTDISSIGATVKAAISNLFSKFSNYQPLLTNPLTQNDVKDNLTSIDVNKPLSANQGKTLKDNQVASISRSGTDFTAKNSSGTTLFTFDQQDSNTWRGIQNNLTSTSTTESLSAYQGYIMSRDIPWYGTSSTAASTIAKVATTSDTKFALVTGAKVSIKFTYNNTASAPTLNVDSKGAKSIKAYGTTAPTSWWKAGDVVTFTYDGTNWIMDATEGQISQINSDLSNKANASDFIVDSQTFTPDSATHGNLYGNIRFKRSGHVVTLELHGLKTLANQYENTVLPVNDILAKYRPNDDVTFMATGGASFYRINVTSNGAITVYPYNGVIEQNNVSGTFSYIVS